MKTKLLLLLLACSGFTLQGNPFHSLLYYFLTEEEKAIQDIYKLPTTEEVKECEKILSLFAIEKQKKTKKEKDQYLDLCKIAHQKSAPPVIAKLHKDAIDIINSQLKFALLMKFKEQCVKSLFLIPQGNRNICERKIKHAQEDGLLSLDINPTSFCNDIADKITKAHCSRNLKIQLNIIENPEKVQSGIIGILQSSQADACKEFADMVNEHINLKSSK